MTARTIRTRAGRRRRRQSWELGKRRSVFGSARPTSPSRLCLPDGLIYRPPIEALQRSAGLRKQLANEIIRFSVDPEEMSALAVRVRVSSREGVYVVIAD